MMTATYPNEQRYRHLVDTVRCAMEDAIVLFLELQKICVYGYDLMLQMWKTPSLKQAPADTVLMRLGVARSMMPGIEI